MECKGTFLDLIFCRFSIGFDNIKNSARQTINWFLKLNRRYFSNASMVEFLDSEIADYCHRPS